MRTIALTIITILMTFISQHLVAQESPENPESEKKIELLESLKGKIANNEKEALKFEVEEINKRLDHGDISSDEAKILKEKAAKKHALNIENRIAIIDNKIELLKRNEGLAMEIDTLNNISSIEFDWGNRRDNGDRLLGIKFSNNKDGFKEIYDRRTYSDVVIALGFNNALIDGQSLENSPYKIGGSRFFELGWAWRTRVFKNSNAVRLHYGVSFQFNGLKPKGNQYFVSNNGQTELQEFEFDLDKSKFRMDNLVFPVNFEFGPSKFTKSEDKIRYSINKKFRFGLGGYAGFNISTRQKLKYKRDGERVKDKLKRDYNTSDLVYGLMGYIGFDGIQLYAKYDLNPIFKNAAVKQRNVSLGLRFDLD